MKQPIIQNAKSFVEQNDKKRIALAIGIIMYLMAGFEFSSAPRSYEQAIGKWRWLFNWVTDMFGSYGMVYFYLVIGTLFIVSALPKNSITRS